MRPDTQPSLRVSLMSLDLMSSGLIRVVADGGCPLVFRAELYSTGTQADSMVYLFSAQTAQRAAVSPRHEPLTFWEEPVRTWSFCLRRMCATDEAQHPFALMPSLVLPLCRQ